MLRAAIISSQTLSALHHHLFHLAGPPQLCFFTADLAALQVLLLTRFMLTDLQTKKQLLSLAAYTEVLG